MSHQSFNPGIPVVVYDGADLPRDGTYYVVAGNGLWLRKDNNLVRAFVPVDRISVLPDLEVMATAESLMPKIPHRLVWRIKEFFRRVVEAYRSEAEVTLYFNKSSAEWRVHVPDQVVSHAGVRYIREAISHQPGMAGFLRAGTVHSHCDFQAFHSGIDIGDEADFDGLHVTFGHNDRDNFTISAAVVVNGHRSPVEPREVLGGIKPTDGSTYQIEMQDSDWSDGLDSWMTQVRPAQSSTLNWRPPSDCLTEGDLVDWAGDLKTVQLRTICGEGPFRVLAVQRGCVTIETSSGLVAFSEKMFRKHLGSHA